MKRRDCPDPPSSELILIPTGERAKVRSLFLLAQRGGGARKRQKARGHARLSANLFQKSQPASRCGPCRSDPLLFRGRVLRLGSNSVQRRARGWKRVHARRGLSIWKIAWRRCGVMSSCDRRSPSRQLHLEIRSTIYPYQQVHSSVQHVSYIESCFRRLHHRDDGDGYGASIRN